MGDLPLPIPLGCWQCQGLNALLQVINVGSSESCENGEGV